MSPKTAGCCFCDGVVRGGSGAPWDTVLYDSGNFIITPTKGALVPGWLLVVAKQHKLCSGALSDSELTELTDCLSTAKRMVRENFGEPTIFEHGPCKSGTAVGCGIDHLHLHVVPLRFSLRRASTSTFPAITWHAIADLSDTSSLFASQIDYGLIQEPKSSFLWCRPPYGTRQFFRRVIATEIGIAEQFDYSRFPHLPNVMLTLNTLPTDPYE